MTKNYEDSRCPNQPSNFYEGPGMSNQPQTKDRTLLRDALIAVAVLLITVLVVILTGCSTTPAEDSTTPAEDPTRTSPTATSTPVVVPGRQIDPGAPGKLASELQPRTRKMLGEYNTMSGNAQGGIKDLYVQAKKSGDPTYEQYVVDMYVESFQELVPGITEFEMREFLEWITR